MGQVNLKTCKFNELCRSRGRTPIDTIFYILYAINSHIFEKPYINDKLMYIFNGIKHPNTCDCIWTGERKLQFSARLNQPEALTAIKMFAAALIDLQMLFRWVHRLVCAKETVLKHATGGLYLKYTPNKSLISWSSKFNDNEGWYFLWCSIPLS